MTCVFRRVYQRDHEKGDIQFHETRIFLFDDCRRRPRKYSGITSRFLRQ